MHHHDSEAFKLTCTLSFIPRSAPLECNAGQVLWADLGFYLQNQRGERMNQISHLCSGVTLGQENVKPGLIY